MIDYKDPIPYVLKLLIPSFGLRNISIYGNTFPLSPKLPSVLVKTAGGNGYFRLQLLARGKTDIEAMNSLISVMNYLERNAQYIQGLRVSWCERESNPISSVDEDTGINEAWCYMRLEAAESNSL